MILKKIFNYFFFLFKFLFLCVFNIYREIAWRKRRTSSSLKWQSWNPIFTFLDTATITKVRTIIIQNKNILFLPKLNTTKINNNCFIFQTWRDSYPHFVFGKNTWCHNWVMDNCVSNCFRHSHSYAHCLGTCEGKSKLILYVDLFI